MANRKKGGLDFMAAAERFDGLAEAAPVVASAQPTTARLRPSVLSLRNKGYSFAEIRRLCAEAGIVASAATIYRAGRCDDDSNDGGAGE